MALDKKSVSFFFPAMITAIVWSMVNGQWCIKKTQKEHFETLCSSEI